MKKILCVDFDGCIHWYRQGWQNGVIYDEPVPGSIVWLNLKARMYEIHIYSSRSKDPELLQKMKAWLMDRMNADSFDLLSFPTQKPPAYLTIDDRAICFRGTFPSDLEIENYKPWNKS